MLQVKVGKNPPQHHDDQSHDQHHGRQSHDLRRGRDAFSDWQHFQIQISAFCKREKERD